MPKHQRFGLFRVRSPLLTKSLLFSFPPGTKMFQFPGLTPFGARPSAVRVAPFGNLRINGYLLLPAAYRSLSRPSSPLRAKASSIRPCLLSSVTFDFFTLYSIDNWQLIIDNECQTPTATIQLNDFWFDWLSFLSWSSDHWRTKLSIVNCPFSIQ